MQKKICTLIAALLLICTFFSMTVIAEKPSGNNESDYFSGSRSLSFVIDRSAIYNYIDGGHNSFCTPFEKYKDWLKLEYTAEKLDLYFTMSFSFSSKEDYIEKLNALLSFSPVIIHDSDNYIEGFSSIELLNFAQIWLETNNRLFEKQFEDLITINNSVLTLNGVEYSSKAAITSISKSLFSFSAISISTSFDDHGYPIRQVRLTPSESSSNDDKLFQRAKNIDGVEITSEDSDYNLIISGSSFNDIANKTMQLLCIPISIKTEYVDSAKNGIFMEYYENIPTSIILDDEGQTDYSISFDDSFGDIVKVSGHSNKNMKLNEKTVSCVSSDIQVKFGVCTGFPFSRMDTTLRLSSSDDTILTQIALYYPTKFSDKYRESVRYLLSFSVPDSALYAEFSDGLNTKIILEWTNKNQTETENALSDFYGVKVSIDYNRETNPFRESILYFSGYANHLPFFPVPFESNSLRIVLPDNAYVKKCAGGSKNARIVTAKKTTIYSNHSDESDASEYDTSIYSGGRETFRITVTYHCYSVWFIVLIVGSVVFLLISLILLILVLLRNKNKIKQFILKIKNFFTGIFTKSSKRKTGKTNTHSYKKATKVKYCRNCGTKNDENSKFCQDCGASLTEVVAIECNTNWLNAFVYWIKSFIFGNRTTKNQKNDK